MSNNPNLVDTLPILDECLAEISPLVAPSIPISLAIDIEGVDLCRYGRVAILQIMSNSSPTVWLIDVTVLGREAFDHIDTHGRSLRAILENANIRKVLDIPNHVQLFSEAGTYGYRSFMMSGMTPMRCFTSMA
jgi:hypothetical protein